MDASPDDVYATPLVTRYAGEAMSRLFSPRARARTWRRLWVALAAAERDLGLPISEEQVRELEARVGDADLGRVAVLEKDLRHDVVAHIHHYGEQCPGAKGIIHLGATSSYVADNGDLLIMREGLGLVRGVLLEAIRLLAALARREAATPCLAYTHLQPAQLTTVGKRVALWLQDLAIDYEEVARLEGSLPFLGVKGATGTQASFLKLFEGDQAKVARLDRLVAERMGFARLLPISAQTYPRKIDHQVAACLAGLAASLSKMAHDVRLGQALGEIEEPFGARQVGSSAMPYKRNPMRTERMSAIARYVIASAQNAPLTAAVQWFERTLDDSANRRLFIPACFLGADALLRLACNVAGGLTVHHRTIERRAAEELPFIATEDILMAAVAAGGDRQALHERIRQHAMTSRERLRQEGGAPDLLSRLEADAAFAAVKGDLASLLAPTRYTGLAREQTGAFLDDVIGPLLARDAALAPPAVEEPRV